MSETIHDVVIVGSGPAGYTAAIYTARAGFKPVVVAGALAAGGALMNTTEVENFPGFPEGVLGPELMDNMRQQAEKFGADVRYEDAYTLELEGDIKKITLEDETLLARSVILATGSEYRHMNVPGEEEFSGRGVSFCATCDGFFFRDKHVIVVGGGDSAMEEATFLTKFASKVTVVHRRDQLRASKAMRRSNSHGTLLSKRFWAIRLSPVFACVPPLMIRLAFLMPMAFSLPSVTFPAPPYFPVKLLWTRPVTSWSMTRVPQRTFRVSSPAVMPLTIPIVRQLLLPAPDAVLPWMRSTGSNLRCKY